MRRLLGFLFLLSALLLPSASAMEQAFDHSPWDQFLKKYVNEKGDVDYAAAKKDPSLLIKYLKSFEDVDPQDFASWPREELMAAYLNVYHAGMIKKILEFYPIRSTNKIPGFWQMDILRIGDHHLGLNEIRETLANNFHDEKAEVALSYASRSGPRLSREAYTGEKVDGQLFLAAKNFANDAEQNQIIPGQRKIYLSPLFKWHAKEFIFNFAAGDQGNGFARQAEFAVLSFLAHYLSDADKLQFLEEGKYKIKYLKFNWDLNDTNPQPAS